MSFMNKLLPAMLGLVLLPVPAFAAQFQVRQIKIGDQAITVMIHKGQSYRKVSLEQLSDRKLDGQLLCLEGKLKNANGTAVRIFGADSDFKAAASDQFSDFVPGDNIWMGGRIDRNGAGRVFTISVAVKLKSDLELFEERFALASSAGDWKKLLELADWISRSRGYNSEKSYEEHRRYRTCTSRAIAKACASAEEAFGKTNAAGYSELADELLRLGADKSLAYKYYILSSSIDPELQKPVKKLSEFGFVRFQGRWVTTEQKKTLEEAEKQRQRNLLLAGRQREARRLEDAISGAMNCASDSIEMQRALAPLTGKALSDRISAEIERAADARLACRALYLAASLSAGLQDKPVAAALRSGEPDIRIAAIELLSVRGDLAARKFLVSVAGKDSIEEVVSLACRLLAQAGDVQAIESLIGLVGSKKAFRSRAAGEALRSATGEDRYTPAEWSVWWKRNKASFPPGPRE